MFANAPKNPVFWIDWDIQLMKRPLVDVDNVGLAGVSLTDQGRFEVLELFPVLFCNGYIKEFILGGVQAP